MSEHDGIAARLFKIIFPGKYVFYELDHHEEKFARIIFYFLFKIVRFGSGIIILDPDPTWPQVPDQDLRH